MTYDEYIKSAEWKVKANAAKQRALFHCQVCYSTDRLIAHHRTYERLFNEIPEDITVLCTPCHELFSACIPAWALAIDLSWTPPPFDQWVAHYA